MLANFLSSLFRSFLAFFSSFAPSRGVVPQHGGSLRRRERKEGESELESRRKAASSFASSNDRSLSSLREASGLSLSLFQPPLFSHPPASLSPNSKTNTQAPPQTAKDAAPEVSARDQELINEFNRLHQRREELEAATRARRADESDAADACEEVSTAYLVADDSESERDGPPVRFVVGECFLHAPSEEAAEARAAAAREEASKEAEKAAEAEKEVEERMRELKSTLYSKFGDSINLEA